MAKKLPFLSDDFHFAIASVAARSAQMEHHLEIAVAHLFGGRQSTGKLLLRTLSSDKIVKLYQALLLDEFPKQKDAINAMISDIEDLRKQRNEVVHWLWGKSEIEGVAYNATMRPFREPQQKRKTVDDIQKIADEMLVCVRRMAEWMETYTQKTILSPPPNGLTAALANG